MNKLSFKLLLSMLLLFSLSACFDDNDDVFVSNTPPTANAGVDKNVVTGLVVLLDGSASSDPDGDTLSYLWALEVKPATSNATLSSTTDVMPSFTPDLDGIYTVSLIVHDGVIASAADSVTFTATPTANNAPVADAGASQNVVTGATVNLDGSASADLDGDPLTYLWFLQATPNGSAASLSDTTATQPSFVADLDGEYRIGLIVNDGTINSAPDTVIVRAAPLAASFAAGQTKYDADCASCHAAGSYDASTAGSAGDLYDQAELLIVDISTIAGMAAVADLTMQDCWISKPFLKTHQSHPDNL